MNEFSNQADDPRAAKAITVGPRDDYSALQKENETLRAEVERLREALRSCVGRLRITLAQLNGEPEPVFDPPIPSALENIKLVAAALAPDAAPNPELAPEASARQDGENEADADWLEAIQSFEWGDEISLAEGNDGSHEDCCDEIVSSIYSIVAQLRRREQAMREALYAARQVIDTYEPAPMANVEARWKIENALAPDAGSTLSNEVERLRKQNAAMRSAISAVDLVLAGASTMPYSEARRILNESLVPGTDARYLTHEQVQPLVRALTYCCGANDSRSRATAHKALAHARTIGFK